MSSPTGVDFMPLRLDSLGVSAPPQKKKRIKTIHVPSEPEPPVITCTNLRDLPSELMVEILDFLRPDPDLIRPVHKYCGIIAISQVSKYFRALALSNQVWYRICVIRWTTKVGFAARLAMADAEADTANPLIRGGFWYSKFCTEERDALRSTIALEELSAATFSSKLWFMTKFQRRIKEGLASGLDWISLSDDTRFDLHSRKIVGKDEPTNGTPFFINDDGSIINIKKSFETGTHSQFSLHVCRREDWGWELRSQAYVFRSVENGSIDGLWSDYTSSLIIEKRKKGIPCTRCRTRDGSSVKYKRREVPDIKEVKEFLEW